MILALLLACADPPVPPTAAPPMPAPARPAADLLGPPVLEHPESALADGDRLWLSVIGGGPTDRDDNGRILSLPLSCAREKGALACIEPTMLSGTRDAIELNAPKGMARVGDELWVADIDRVRRFVLPLGDPSPDVLLPGATFVNDLAPDGRGGAWVSDTAMDSGTPAVWHVDREGQARRRIEGAALGQPNGLLRRGEGLLIARWDEVEGGGAVLQWSPEGGLLPWARLPSAGLDGLVALPAGRVAVTSWGGRCLYLLSPEGQLLETRSLFGGPADLELDPDGQRLWVPAFLDGDLRSTPL